MDTPKACIQSHDCQGAIAFPTASRNPAPAMLQS